MTTLSEKYRYLDNCSLRTVFTIASNGEYFPSVHGEVKAIMSGKSYYLVKKNGVLSNPSLGNVTVQEVTFPREGGVPRSAAPIPDSEKYYHWR